MLDSAASLGNARLLLVALSIGRRSRQLGPRHKTPIIHRFFCRCHTISPGTSPGESGDSIASAFNIFCTSARILCTVECPAATRVRFSPFSFLLFSLVSSSPLPSSPYLGNKKSGDVAGIGLAKSHCSGEYFRAFVGACCSCTETSSMLGPHSRL